jgi:hypothetical protein
MRDSISRPPSYRPVNQRWIFMLYESPIHSGSYSEYRSLFNMTSTYRIHSDFANFYATGSSIKWRSNQGNNLFNESIDYFDKKINFAAAIISNCNEASKRLEYIKRLQSHVNVDIFGECGKQCPIKFTKTDQSGNCKEIVATEYKFFLAFENSICKDYITEKFFAILRYNIIPVVLGGGKYDHYVRLSRILSHLSHKSSSIYI